MAKKKEIKKVEPKKIVKKAVKLPSGIVNVYSAEFGVIDDLIEEIKKTTRKVSVNDYATNNVYIILSEALNRVKLAGD